MPASTPTSTSRPRRRALAAGAALAVLGAGALASPAAAEVPVAEPAANAAGWLTAQLVDGERLEITFDGTAFPAQGQTADAVLGFAAVGVADDAASAATAWLSEPANVAAYTGGGDAESYAGATAKLALVAAVRGDDPRDVGGVDLVERLEDLLAASGRYGDRSAFGDFSNVIGQSLALIALDRAGAPAPVVAEDLLLASQCADGGFDLTLQPGPGECTSAVDATGYAVEALAAVGRDAEAAEAADWLVEVQADGGGFSSDAEADTGVNANSTGLAAMALRTAGEDAAADAAVAFLRTLQVGCAAPVAQRGAITLSGDFDTTSATLATTQALLGFGGASLATLSADGAEPGVPADGCEPVAFACEGTTPATFPDVPAANVHAGAVGCLAALDPPLLDGRADGTFGPAAPLTRGQAASVLVRLLSAAGVELPAGDPARFPDVEGDVHAAAIRSLAAAEVVSGRADGSYGPSEPVTRGALASLLARTFPVATGTTLAAGPDAFPDDDGSVHEAALDALAAYGVVAGRADGTVGEGQGSTRDQAASVFARFLGTVLIEQG